MSIIGQIIKKAQERPARIVFPEGSDLRIIRAAHELCRQRIASPVLLGDLDQISEVATREKCSLDGCSIISPSESDRLERYAAEYARMRGRKIELARKLVQKPLAFGGMMVHAGDADGMVAGAESTTAAVIQNSILTVGLQPGFTSPSSFFIMVIPEYRGQTDSVLLFADCAVTTEPDHVQLADICIATGRNARALLGMKPKIAFLSFSTKGSASHASIDKIRQAVAVSRERAPDLDIDGEFQADAALEQRVAAKKVNDESPVAGTANVLIFPDLNSGNIAYKLVQYLARAVAIGPVLQGFAKPVSDLSRGASADDIVGVTAITVVQAQQSMTAETAG